MLDPTMLVSILFRTKHSPSPHALGLNPATHLIATCKTSAEQPGCQDRAACHLLAELRGWVFLLYLILAGASTSPKLPSSTFLVIGCLPTYHPPHPTGERPSLTRTLAHRQAHATHGLFLFSARILSSWVGGERSANSSLARLEPRGRLTWQVTPSGCAGGGGRKQAWRSPVASRTWRQLSGVAHVCVPDSWGRRRRRLRCRLGAHFHRLRRVRVGS